MNSLVLSKKNRFLEKRNYDISHKEMPEEISEEKFIHISYSTIVKGIVKALRLMKKIDTCVLGPSAKYGWREMRKRRYEAMYPVHMGYRLLPYVWLSHKERFQIIQEELQQGYTVWEDMPIKINDHQTVIKACGKWGAIILGEQIVLLDAPFIELTEINIPVSGNSK